MFKPDGHLRGAAPVLLGIAKGDDSVPGIGDRELSDMPPEVRTTPAGRFVASLGRNASGKDVLWVDYDAAISMHRVINTNPKERRPYRLATPTPLDNRISYGCINVPIKFFDDVVQPAFEGTNGIVYILPEVHPYPARVRQGVRRRRACAHEDRRRPPCGAHSRPGSYACALGGHPRQPGHPGPVAQIAPQTGCVRQRTDTIPRQGNDPVRERRTLVVDRASHVPKPRRRAVTGRVPSEPTQEKLNMKSSLKRVLCSFLVIAMAMLPFQSGQAGMIGSDLAIASAASQADRNTVTNFLNRAETASQLQTLGVDAQSAKERVAAMTDSEIASLAGKINSLPVGADSGAGTLLLVILIIWAVWYFAFRR